MNSQRRTGSPTKSRGGEEARVGALSNSPREEGGHGEQEFAGQSLELRETRPPRSSRARANGSSNLSPPFAGAMGGDTSGPTRCVRSVCVSPCREPWAALASLRLKQRAQGRGVDCDAAMGTETALHANAFASSSRSPGRRRPRRAWYTLVAT